MSQKTVKNKLLLASEKLAQIDQENKFLNTNNETATNLDLKLDDESLDDIAENLSTDKKQKEKQIKIAILSIFFFTIFLILFQLIWQKHKTIKYANESTNLIIKTKNAIVNQFSTQHGFSKVNSQSLTSFGINLQLPFSSIIQIETVGTPNAFALSIPSSPSNICSEIIKNLSPQFQSIKVDGIIVQPDNFDSLCSKRGQNNITFFYFDPNLQIAPTFNTAPSAQHNVKTNPKTTEELVPLLPPIEPGGRSQSPYEELPPKTPGQPVLIPNYQPSNNGN